MGMFDYVRCDVPLPDNWKPDELQTKDFDCEMVTHIISADGRLLLDRGYYEDVPLAERPYPDAEPDDWRSLCGILRRVQKYEDANFHGLVNFYGGDQGDWHHYNAKFTNGQLIEITKLKD